MQKSNHTADSKTGFPDLQQRRTLGIQFDGTLKRLQYKGSISIASIASHGV